MRTACERGVSVKRNEKVRHCSEEAMQQSSRSKANRRIPELPLLEKAAKDFVVLRLNILSPDAAKEHAAFFLRGETPPASPEGGAANFDPQRVNLF